MESTDDTFSTTPTGLKIGSVIDERYEILQRLGVGGMGVVVRVRDRRLGSDEVALKLLHPSLVSESTALDRFRNEVRLMRKLSHPNIVTIYEFGESREGLFYLSMEYVRGSSLGDLLKSENFSLRESLEILYQVALGAAHAHELGVIHRDLKPDNVLIRDDGKVKITDFGLARSLLEDHSLTKTGDTVGTPYYMAPEQLCGATLDSSCDVYSLGIMAYQMVCGALPFNNENYFALAGQHMQEELPAMQIEEGTVPCWLEAFISKAAAKKAPKRFPDAGVFASELRRHIDTELPKLGPIERMVEFLRPNGVMCTYLRERNFPRELVLGVIAFFVAAYAVFGVIRNVPVLRRSTGSAIIAFEHSLQSSAASTLLFPLRSLLGTTEYFSEGNLIDYAYLGKKEEVFLLLDAGVSPNVKDARGRTPLHAAAESGNTEIISLLLNYGALLDSAERFGRTPLMTAAISKQQHAVKLLLERDAPHGTVDNRGYSALMHAASKGDIRSVEQLLRRVPDVNIRAENGKTALHLAAEKGEAETVRLLLPRVYRLDVLDSSGKTPLDYARGSGDRSTIALLQESSV